jgi:hypothetical protein
VTTERPQREPLSSGSLLTLPLHPNDRVLPTAEEMAKVQAYSGSAALPPPEAFVRALSALPMLKERMEVG